MPRAQKTTKNGIPMIPSAPKKRKPVSDEVRAKRIANLKPVAKGQVLNPSGRKGKLGDKGFSFVDTWRMTLQRMDPVDRDNLLIGLLRKVIEGDLNAIRLAVDLNLEQVGLGAMVNQAIEDGGVRISVAMPAKEPDVAPAETPPSEG